MRVQPDSGEPLDRQPLIDLLIEKIGHGRVVEGDRDGTTGLTDKSDVFDRERINGAGDSEAADFDAVQIPPEQQLGPRQRREPETR